MFVSKEVGDVTMALRESIMSITTINSATRDWQIYSDGDVVDLIFDRCFLKRMLRMII